MFSLDGSDADPVPDFDGTDHEPTLHDHAEDCAPDLHHDADVGYTVDTSEPHVPAPHDRAITPSAEDVALARHELVGGHGAPPSQPDPGEPIHADGQMVDGGNPASVESPVPVQSPPAGAAAPPAGAPDPAHEPTKGEAEAALANANDAQETAQLLSQIASVRHQTAMGIIGNIR